MKGSHFVSKNSVGMFIREKDKRVSSELIPQLEEKVKELVESAIRRADKNGRSTVMPHDL